MTLSRYWPVYKQLNSIVIINSLFYRCAFLAGEGSMASGAAGLTGDDTGRGILEPRAAAGDVSPKQSITS